MYKKMALIVISILFLGVSLSPVSAKELKIEDYNFIWHAAKAGDVTMDIEKTRETLQVVLNTPGGALGRVSATPSQAEVIGEVLKKTNEYYDKQASSQDSKSEDTAPAGDYSGQRQTQLNGPIDFIHSILTQSTQVLSQSFLGNGQHLARFYYRKMFKASLRRLNFDVHGIFPNGA